MISSKKEKIQSIIFVRACCCIGIIIFHYFCDSKGKFKLLYKTANSDFGFMFVTSFFSNQDWFYFIIIQKLYLLKVFIIKDGNQYLFLFIFVIFIFS